MRRLGTSRMRGGAVAGVLASLAIAGCGGSSSGGAAGTAGGAGADGASGELVVTASAASGPVDAVTWNLPYGEPSSARLREGVQLLREHRPRQRLREPAGARPGLHPETRG